MRGKKFPADLEDLRKKKSVIQKEDYNNFRRGVSRNAPTVIKCDTETFKGAGAAP